MDNPDKELDITKNKEISNECAPAKRCIWGLLFNLAIIVALVVGGYLILRAKDEIKSELSVTRSQLTQTKEQLKNIKADMALIEQSYKEAHSTAEKLKYELSRVPSIESKVKSLNELVVAKLSKDGDKLNLASSYLGDAIRYVKKMATWNFAVEAIQLAKFNLMQYPDYLMELNSIQEEMEEYSLEPWHRLQEVYKKIDSTDFTAETKRNVVVEKDSERGVLKHAWHKIKGSIKVQKVDEIKAKITREDREYLIKERLLLLIDEASYAILTDREHVYISSINKAIEMISSTDTDVDLSALTMELQALTKVQSPTMKLVNRLELVKINLDQGGKEHE